MVGPGHKSEKDYGPHTLIGILLAYEICNPNFLVHGVPIRQVPLGDR